MLSPWLSGPHISFTESLLDHVVGTFTIELVLPVLEVLHHDRHSLSVGAEFDSLEQLLSSIAVLNDSLD